MPVVEDPAGEETRALFDVIDFSDIRILEVGSGDGRLTWLYAGEVRSAVGLEPGPEDIEIARADLPGHLAGRVQFIESTINDYALPPEDPAFDAVLLSHSL